MSNGGPTTLKTPVRSLRGVVTCLALALASGGAACSRECDGSRAEVAHLCTSTFDGDVLHVTPCPPQTQVLVNMCGPLVELIVAGDTYTECFYDARSQQLVGARHLSNTADFC